MNGNINLLSSKGEDNVLIDQLYVEKDLMKRDIKCVTKSIELSEEIRKGGNDKYHKNKCSNQELEEITQIYTESIAFAPSNSEALALAYSNRSAVLRRMEKYNESVEDINKALGINKLNLDLEIKLICRKVECLAAMGSPEAEKVFNEAVNMSTGITDQSNNTNNNVENSLKKAKDALCKLIKERPSKKKNTPEHMKILALKESENLFDNISVENVRSKKHLIVNRNFKAGEIIFVDRPYTTCLYLSHSRLFCGYCLKKSWINIPCDSCNWCMFCSEDCKRKAWMHYHDVECFTVSHYISVYHGIKPFDQLCLRSLLIGIREYGDVVSFQNNLLTDDKWIDESRSLNENFLNNYDFKSLYALCGPATGQLRKCVITTARILIILYRYTSLFGQNLMLTDIKDLVANDHVKLIGLVLLNLMIKSSRNHFTLQKDECPWGACISPISSYISHSCNPNIRICITDDQKLIFYALQPIQKNCQLFLSYRHTFFEVEKQIRNNWITRNTHFRCLCEACSQSWPTLIEMYKMPKEKPYNYAMSFKQRESDLYDENDPLVSPILNRCGKVRVNQTTLNNLSKAIERATKDISHPSVVICELMICFGIVFEKLYGSTLTH